MTCPGRGTRPSALASAQNSRNTRVTPVFSWFRDECSDPEWATRFLSLTTGLRTRTKPGRVLGTGLEVGIAPSSRRLRWLLQEGEAWTPASTRDELRARARGDAAREALAVLERDGELPGRLRRQRLERATFADAIIWCERLLIWIEGKRNESLSRHTTFDSGRDQLARDLEAAWRLARMVQKDYCVVICHEHELRGTDRRLVEAYWSGDRVDGLRHLTSEEWRPFADRLGTVTWKKLAEAWPELQRRLSSAQSSPSRR